MRILGTRKDCCISKLICELTEEPISHVALEFPAVGYIIHSNMMGVHRVDSNKFRRENRVIATATPYVETADEAGEIEEVSKILEKWGKAKYDRGAFVFLGICLWLRRHFNIPLPKSNLWQTTGMFLCTEFVSNKINQKENSMMTPWQLMRSLPLSEWSLSVSNR